MARIDIEVTLSEKIYASHGGGKATTWARFKVGPRNVEKAAIARLTALEEAENAYGAQAVRSVAAVLYDAEGAVNVTSVMAGFPDELSYWQKLSPAERRKDSLRRPTLPATTAALRAEAKGLEAALRQENW